MAEKKELLKELAGGASDVVLVGKVKLTENSFSGDQLSEKNKDNPWAYRRANFGIETADGNVVYVQLSGGYHAKAKAPVAYSQDKDYQQVQVPWANRKLEDVIESLNPYKLLRGGLTKDGDKLKIEKFVSGWDLYEYLEEHLQNEMWVTVRAEAEYREYKDEVSHNFEVQSVFLYEGKKVEGVEEPVKTGFTKLTQTVFLNTDSFKRVTKEDKESGQVLIQAFVPQYVGKLNGKEIKKTIPYPMPIYVPLNTEKPEQTEAILNKMFKVKKDTLRELTIECAVVEGFESSEPNSKDVSLSSEVQELIALGLYTEEEAKSTASVRGNKIRKFVFTRPNLRKDKDSGSIILPMYDDKYDISALFAHVQEEEKVDSVEEHNIDMGDGDAEGGDDWMTAIGLS